MQSQEPIVAQENVERATDIVWKYVVGDGGDDPHYARITNDFDNLTAEIMWKGTLPAEIAALEGTSKEGVRVTIVKVPLSQGDITIAAKKAFELSRQGRIPALVNIGSNAAFDGMEVAVTPEVLKSMDQVAVAATIEDATGVPVTFAVGTGGAAASGSSGSASSTPNTRSRSIPGRRADSYGESTASR